MPITYSVDVTNFKGPAFAGNSIFAGNLSQKLSKKYIYKELYIFAPLLTIGYRFQYPNQLYQ